MHRLPPDTVVGLVSREMSAYKPPSPHVCDSRLPVSLQIALNLAATYKPSGKIKYFNMTAVDHQATPLRRPIVAADPEASSSESSKSSSSSDQVAGPVATNVIFVELSNTQCIDGDISVPLLSHVIRRSCGDFTSVIDYSILPCARAMRKAYAPLDVYLAVQPAVSIGTARPHPLAVSSLMHGRPITEWVAPVILGDEESTNEEIADDLAASSGCLERVSIFDIYPVHLALYGVWKSAPFADTR